MIDADRASCAPRREARDRRRADRPPRSRSCACATSAARPSCRTCCAASPSCRPRSAAPVGKAANQARQALEALIDARARRARGAASSTRGWPPTASTSRCPATPPQPVGRLHLLTADPARDRGRLPRPRLHASSRAPRSRPSTTTSTRSTTPDAPGARRARDTFYVGRRRVVLRTHTSPMQVRAMEAHPPPLYVVDPGPRLPAATPTPRTRRSSTRSRAWPSTRTSRWPTSRARCCASRARSSATTARCACARTSSRSPSRASRSTSRCFNCNGRAS